jgi:transposase-like protein
MSIMETTAKKNPRPRRSFTPEFKAEVVALVRQQLATPPAAWPVNWN